MDGMERFKMAQLFRKSAIEKLSSPEQLDKSIVVTSPMSWTVLIGIAIIIVCFGVWAFCGSMPTTLEAQGVISNGIYTNSIYSEVSGTVEDIFVSEGEKVNSDEVLATIVDSNQELHKVVANESCTITKLLIEKGCSVNYTDEMFGISPISNNDGFVVFYVGIEQLPNIKTNMDVVINLPAFDNQKYGHMKGTIVQVDTIASSEEAIKRVVGNNENVIEYLNMMAQPVAAVTCKIEKDSNSANGYFWSSDKGHSLSVNKGSVVNVKVIMDEQAPITKLIPGLE